MKLSKKYIYSIGERENAVVFPLTDTSISISRAVKNREVDNEFGDGIIDLSGDSLNYLSGNNIILDTRLDAERYTLDFLKKVFYTNAIYKVFFLEYLNLDESGGFTDVRMKWTYCRIVSGADDESDSDDPNGQNLISVRLVFRLLYPYYFVSDTYVLDTSTFTGIYPLSWGDSAVNYGQSGITYGVLSPGYEKLTSSLTKLQKDNFFRKCDGKYSLRSVDYFIRPENRIPPFSVSAVSVSAGSTVSTSTANFDLDLNTVLNSDINIIKLDSGASPVFTKDDYIEIYNNTTNSGFRLTWNTATDSGAVVYFNTYTLELYNDVGLIYDPIIEYSVELYDNTVDRVLSFSSFERLNPNRVPTASAEEFQITSGLANNTDAQITNLKTFI